MTPFPTTFPLDDVSGIATMIRDGSAKTKMATFGNHVWAVQGYGMGTLLHDDATASAHAFAADHRAALEDCHAAIVGACVDAGLDLPVSAEPVGKLGDGVLLQKIIGLLVTYGPTLYPWIQKFFPVLPPLPA